MNSTGSLRCPSALGNLLTLASSARHPKDPQVLSLCSYTLFQTLRYLGTRFTIHIDFTGKLSGKSDRKKYCSVIIDAFTKYVLLEHTSSLDAASAVRAVKNAVCLFGALKRIIADQGRSYISQDLKNFCSEHNIKLHFIATGSSRANRQVQRVIRTLKSLLTIIENDPNKRNVTN